MTRRRKKPEPLTFQPFHLEQPHLRTQTPEPEHPRWAEYLNEKNVTTYVPDCPCVGCEANRRFFWNFWLPAKIKDERDESSSPHPG